MERQIDDARNWLEALRHQAESVVEFDWAKPGFGELKATLEALRAAEEESQRALALSRRREAEMAGLLAASRFILEQRGFRQTARSIFEVCRELTGATSGYVALLSSDQTRNEVLFLEAGGRPCSVDPALPMPIRGLREIAYRTGRAVYDNDFLRSDWAGLMPDGHVRLDNVLFAPLCLGGKPVGVLGLANKPGGFTEDDVRVATAFGDLAALALLNSRAQEALEQSSERFQAVAQSATDAIVSIDSQGRIVFWNTVAETVFGYPSLEIMGQTVNQILPERFRQAHDAGMARAASTGTSKMAGRTIESVGLRKNGREFPLEMSLATWTTGEGQFFTAIIRDITERKGAEEKIRQLNESLERRVVERTAALEQLNAALLDEVAQRQTVDALLKQSEQKYRTVADFTYDWETWVSPKGTFLYVSPSCERISGYRPEEFVANPDLLRTIVHADDRPLIDQHYFKIQADETSICNFDFRIVSRSGEIRWLAHMCQPVRSAQGQYLGRRGSNREITQRKRAEEALRALRFRLRQSQDEERRRIARDLHDSTSQQLAAALMNLGSLEQQMPAMDAQTAKLVTESLALVERCSQEVRTVSYLLHPPFLDQLGLGPALRSYVEGFSRRSGIQVKVDLPAELPRFSSPVELALFRVAQESLGNIHRHSDSREAWITLQAERGLIRLEIGDRGRGLPAELLEGFAQGIMPQGVGIAGMRERLAEVGGKLELRSEASETRVRAIIPLPA